jgi:hypothetical protein
MELGHIDIITDVSMLSTYLCLPREGHMDAVFHMSAYLGYHHNTRVVFDPAYHVIDICGFVNTDWKSMCGDMKELLLSDAPAPHGKDVYLRLLILIILVSSSQGVQGLDL